MIRSGYPQVLSPWDTVGQETVGLYFHARSIASMMYSFNMAEHSHNFVFDIDELFLVSFK